MNVTHKLYLDDSGNKDYSGDRVYSTIGGRTPYFVFGGMLLQTSAAGFLDAKFAALKQKTFGCPNIEIKAHWLRRLDQRKKRFLDPFGITDGQLNQFSDGLYQAILDTDCELLACVVDKAAVQAMYPNPHYPPAIAYECVLQRVQMDMKSRDGAVHVTIDDMTGSTPNGREWRGNLERQHELLRKNGSGLQRGMQMDRIAPGLAFRDSANDNRVQACDLVAYSVYRQFVDHGEKWEDKSSSLPVYEYLNRLATRFRNHRGTISGYGIIKFPALNRIPWGA